MGRGPSIEHGQRVQVTVHLVDSGREVSIEGEIVWANQQLGDMALRFLTISAGGREAIAGYLIESAAQR
jgi:PilZ domain